MRRLLAGLCLAALAGCAATPEFESASASSECERLAAEASKNDQALRVALPVAVAAIYVAADSEAAEAEQRRTELRRELEVRGCMEDA
jgi:hypothetical protein